MALQGTLVKIDSVTVGAGGQATIDFQNIPSTYSDLKLVLSSRISLTANLGYALVEFNGVGTNQSSKMLSGEGSAGGSAYSANYSNIVFFVNGASSTSSTFGNAEMYIPGYASASTNKVTHIDCIIENNAAFAAQSYFTGLWQTNAAISRITLHAADGSFNKNQTFLQHTTATLYGISPTTSQIKATGGAVFEDTNYIYHLFGATGSFRPTQTLSCDVLVVAGGGGAATGPGGGGGAGQALLYSAQSLTATNYTVTVGGGGTGGAASTSPVYAGGNGTGSQFGALTAATPGNGSTNETGGSSGNGNAGGSASISTYYLTGGGGGLGAVGAAGSQSLGYSGAGGAGINTYASWLNATRTGVSGFIGGGGGGGAAAWSNNAYLDSDPMPGGTGGGGGGGQTGVNNENSLPGGDGTANTGSGGGGAGYWFQAGVANRRGKGGNGGSGLVIVRYAK
jgi:hypothetical protein